MRPRQLPQSLGCGKNFLGPAKLTTQEQVVRLYSVYCMGVNTACINVASTLARATG